jgi:GT2 family glycosyltransferase
MNWRWRRPGQGEAEPDLPIGPQPETLSIDQAIAQADAFRDARRWAEAAEAYQSVVERAPTRTPIWVQLGHARKESGDLPGAEDAYGRALNLAPDTADTHLQLGHVLKMQGQRPAAVTAYAMALRADRSCNPALTELIAMGEGWAAEQASGLGQTMLGTLLQTVADLRVSLDRLERALPDAASLAAVPTAQYRLFQSRFRLPPAPPAPPAGWGVVVLDQGDPKAMIELLQSLAAQERPPASVTVLTADPATRTAVARAGLGCPVTCAEPGSVLPACDWRLVIACGSVLVPGALPWLDWAANQLDGSDARGFYTDEDTAEQPVLKAVDDQEADVPLFRHTMVALRGDVPDPVQALTEDAETGIGHLARILVRRVVPPPPPDRRAARPQGPPGNARIAILVPTRNGGGSLRDGLDALRGTAAEPALLDIVVLDNGSDDPATLAYLAELQTTGIARVIRDPAPFNWSRLNNAGVAATSGPLILFINDDVTLTSAGWDQILRRQLARPEIGAVGVRLDYPDGALQHAGIVLGPGGRSEHEGVATIGVPDDIAARWLTRRSVAAVTGAFLACRRTVFTSAGGFDAAHLPIWSNDVDFCLRLRESGLLILYEPAIRAIHHESRTLSAQPRDAERAAIWDQTLEVMRQRWGDALATDPGFNPHFVRIGRPFELMIEPSIAAVRFQLLRSASASPWRIARAG